VTYAVTLPDDTKLNLTREYSPDGAMENIVTSAAIAVPATRWGIERACYSSANAAPTVAATLESGPFYVRSMINTEWLGEPITAVHESLSLTRFAKPIVQAMLPFRMPRW
jgi:carotenoid 1,2-hydratase